MKTLKLQKIIKFRNKIILCLIGALLITSLNSIPVQAADYPLFLPDEFVITANVGDKVKIKYKIYPEYINEKISINVYDSSGKIVAWAERDFYNVDDSPFTYSVSWDTKGEKAGEYTVVAKMQFYTYYSWHECPSSRTTYITLKATRPGKQTIKSLKTQKGKKLKVSWKKDSKANGYQIQYSTDKKFRKSVKSITISNNKTTSKTISNLKKGKQYYVRVRSYSKNPGSSSKLYGTWSNTKRSSKIK
ncbi:MAG: fibronectin type III domain-containing protein [Lachnospiraceae bacterium]|jgi:Fibronectin type III domain.|nr:fibronectin type III domain-containing protein [Lachnospiraceae bacterium]